MTKIVLFLVLIGIAACNRFLTTPALSRAEGLTARSRLSRSIIAETAVGLAVVILAGVLLELPPGMEMPGMSMPSRIRTSSSAMLGRQSPTLAPAAPESLSRHNST